MFFKTHQNNVTFCNISLDILLPNGNTLNMNADNRIINALGIRCARYTQSDLEALQYTFNYAAVLGGDTIATSIWTDHTGGLTLSSEVDGSTSASVIISGDAGDYVLTNLIESTTGNETIGRQLFLRIFEADGDVELDYAD